MLISKVIVMIWSYLRIMAFFPRAEDVLRSFSINITFILSDRHWWHIVTWLSMRIQRMTCFNLPLRYFTTIWYLSLVLSWNFMESIRLRFKFFNLRSSSGMSFGLLSFDVLNVRWRRLSFCFIFWEFISFIRRVLTKYIFTYSKYYWRAKSYLKDWFIF